MDDYRSRQPSEPALWDFMSNKFPSVKGLFLAVEYFYGRRMGGVGIHAVTTVRRQVTFLIIQFK